MHDILYAMWLIGFFPVWCTRKKRTKHYFRGSRFSSDFDSEDDLPISHLKSDSSRSTSGSNSGSKPTTSGQTTTGLQPPSTNQNPGNQPSSSQNETTLTVETDKEPEMISKPPKTTESLEDKKRKEKLTKVDSEEYDHKAKKKKKKNGEEKKVRFVLRE